MKAVVLLGGKGARMRPLTYTTPKPLLKIGAKTGLAYNLDALSRLNVSEFIFIVGYMGEKIEAYVEDNYDIKCTFIEQTVLDGTAGATFLAKKFVDEPFLLLFGDSLFDVDYSIINDKHDMILWTKKTETPELYGICQCDNDIMQKIIEKPQEFVGDRANAGVYFVQNFKLFFDAIQYLYDNDVMVKNEYYLTDAFNHMIEQGANIYCPYLKAVHDFGNPKAFLDTQKHQEHFVDKSAVLDNTTLKENVCVQKNTSIKNSTLINCAIGENCVLENVALHDSIIGDNCKINGAKGSLILGDDSVVKDI